MLRSTAACDLARDLPAPARPDVHASATRGRSCPYLRDLGVSHLYLSPSLQARSGSTHGYDVVDPTRISDDLGGEEAFRALAAAGLGVLLDVVPNHMAASDENRFWRDPELRAAVLRPRRRDRLAPALLRHRRARRRARRGPGGVRGDAREGARARRARASSTACGSTIPTGSPTRAATSSGWRAEGVEHVWVEKILEPGERAARLAGGGDDRLRVPERRHGALRRPATARSRSRALYEELTGERRPFAEVADEAKLEQARTTFRPELERLRRARRPTLGSRRRLASLHVYRTYVEPWYGRGSSPTTARRSRRLADGPAAHAAARGERGHDEFVTRFQQTTGPVMAKGVEDTAFYR